MYGTWAPLRYPGRAVGNPASRRIVRCVSDASLAPLTTLGLGGPAATLVTAADASEIVEAVRLADATGQPLLVLAGGSNVVVADQGFRGTVVLVRSGGVVASRRGDAIEATVQAGHDWDALVAEAVAEGWSGLECLSGIPGSTGATPIQNVGAYGAEVAETLIDVTVYDRVADQVVQLSAAECGFGYRHSTFKETDRYVVLSVRFRLTPQRESQPLRYGELTRVLGVPAGGTAPLGDVRDAVLALRRGKGMVLDPDDPDTRSVGSFFTNPVLDPAVFAELEARLPEAPPRWEGADGRVKTSAAWLIERAGFRRGYGRDGVAISTKHTLALTNRGDGTTAALLSLAEEIVAGVRDAFGVTLVPEPRLVGVDFSSVPA
ncbi:UDP-N-acetylmuramate dehydrogenase [Cryptosporangium minutisporangium]|uniref:UDP-N-acetylenolpyruvoylglucosamine reductase n=1 Tax=Cryptosporangium minutisporangium TaxID=113569 RepID=A0ABP6T7R6_9ACTN